MSKKRNKRGLNIDRRLLILFSIMPVGCLFAILVGLLIAWRLFPTRFVDAQMSELPEEQAQEVVIMVAADFAEHHDVKRAKESLAKLEVPNTAQYVSMVAERMIQVNRGPVDEEIKNVVDLAEALGVSTVSMIAYVSTPTSTPTNTPPPTPTPTNTPVVSTSTPTLVIEVQTLSAEEAIPAENEAISPETPTPEPEPTDPPLPPSPTDTPEPTPTPTPEFDFTITKVRLLNKEENGGCLGMHSIFVTVVDAAGNPLKGVEMGDAWNAVPGVVTGHKGDDQPGLAVYDLYKNGYMIFVKSDPTAGRPVTSQQTELLSSNDWEIGIPRLIEAGYCPDEGTCRVLWNSGVAGEGNNSLCWGHYSWEVTFQRAW
ncbi:MAG: hypothetical protein JXM69_06080 [Anaerolineae bacterium]|nr:hypothetical protein [Anaerolineae bacterium]